MHRWQEGFCDQRHEIRLTAGLPHAHFVRGPTPGTFRSVAAVEKKGGFGSRPVGRSASPRGVCRSSTKSAERMRTMLTNRRTGLISSVLVVVTALAACGDDGVGPDEITREDVTRGFSAVTFRTTTDGTTTDQLAQGATLNIALHEDGTTTGGLFVPGGAEGGGDLNADLAGTFSFSDVTDQVTFDHAADTFVRDMTFTALRADNAVQLEGEETFGDTTVRVVLR